MYGKFRQQMADASQTLVKFGRCWQYSGQQLVDAGQALVSNVGRCGAQGWSKLVRPRPIWGKLGQQMTPLRPELAEFGPKFGLRSNCPAIAGQFWGNSERQLSLSCLLAAVAHRCGAPDITRPGECVQVPQLRLSVGPDPPRPGRSCSCAAGRFCSRAAVAAASIDAESNFLLAMPNLPRMARRHCGVPGPPMGSGCPQHTLGGAWCPQGPAGADGRSVASRCGSSTAQCRLSQSGSPHDARPGRCPNTREKGRGR